MIVKILIFVTKINCVFTKSHYNKIRVDFKILPFTRFEGVYNSAGNRVS